jgi:hypothetical protein
MTIKENLQKAQQKFLEQLKELEINNQRLIMNNNLLIKDLTTLETKSISRTEELAVLEDLDFLETTLIDLVSSLNEKLRTVVEFIAEAERKKKEKKDNKNKKLSQKSRSYRTTKFGKNIDQIKSTMSFFVSFMKKQPKRRG